jgi:hypothetical protein
MRPGRKAITTDLRILYRPSVRFRDSQRGSRLYLTNRSCPRHWLRFTLAPLLGAIRDRTVPAGRPAANGTAQHHRGGAYRDVPGLGLIAAHSHVHAHGHVLDLNAAWFSVVSIVSKEWLFPITHKVADQENSPVSLANAYYRRSDAYSCVVTLVAILGSGWFPALPLGSIGGAYYLHSRHLIFAVLFAHVFLFPFLE